MYRAHHFLTEAKELACMCLAHRCFHTKMVELFLPNSGSIPTAEGKVFPDLKRNTSNDNQTRPPACTGVAATTPRE